jgi:hypothetical protein
MTAQHLQGQGYGRALRQRYMTGDWLESSGRGAYPIMKDARHGGSRQRYLAPLTSTEYSQIGLNMCE